MKLTYFRAGFSPSVTRSLSINSNKIATRLSKKHLFELASDIGFSFLSFFKKVILSDIRKENQSTAGVSRPKFSLEYESFLAQTLDCTDR